MFNSYHSLQEIELKTSTLQKIIILGVQAKLHYIAPCAIFFLHHGDRFTPPPAKRNALHLAYEDGIGDRQRLHLVHGGNGG
jgi:hypothetical protein